MLRAFQNANVRSVGDLAEMPAVREALRWFTEQKQWIQEQHLEICRIPAPTFFEQARADWLSAKLRELGCDVRRDGAGNVVARSRKAPRLAKRQRSPNAV